MLLATDIGNTNLVLGVFEGERLKATWRFSTDVHKLADEYAAVLANLLPLKGLAFSDIESAIISSSVPPLVAVFEELCQRYFEVTPTVVGPGTKTGVRISIDNPREVGADRVVNAAAAHRLYGGPLIVIDFGTATTLDAVSAEGDYLGGAIAPGIEISAEALFEHAAKLPRVEMVRPQKAIGGNSVAAMQSGIIFGYVGLVEGLVARMRKELGGKAKVIATGGLANIIAKETTIIDALEPDLTLIGLSLIYELNLRR
ncbi:MAG TPA: type III pantothenate kinase [Dehalococcoidia bacterium]|nr:type III pantothenate kinase [Dehalococcoidia bacterium]